MVGRPFTADVLHRGSAAVYQVAGLPPGLVAENRRITGTPETTGTYRVLLEAGGLFDKDYEVVTMVVQSGEKPVQQAVSTLALTPGEAFAFTIALSGRVTSWHMEGMPDSFLAEVTEQTPERFVTLGTVRGVASAPGSRVTLESVATNAFGTSRKPIVITATGSPFLAQPAGSVVAPGETVPIRVELGGELPAGARMRWYWNGAPLQDDGRVSGSESLTLTLSEFQAEQTGWYSWRAHSADDELYLQSEQGWYGTATTWETWLEAAGMSGTETPPHADPDGNGAPLLVEFALGYAALSSWPTLASVDGTLTYLRPQAISGVDVQVEASTDLNTWATVPWEASRPEDAVGTSHVVSRANLRKAFADEPAVWWRLSASLIEE